jgi:hypothetical protein
MLGSLPVREMYAFIAELMRHGKPKKQVQSSTLYKSVLRLKINSYNQGPAVFISQKLKINALYSPSRSLLKFPNIASKKSEVFFISCSVCGRGVTPGLSRMQRKKA